MVATKLSQIAGKGWGWYRSTAAGEGSTSPADSAAVPLSRRNSNPIAPRTPKPSESSSEESLKSTSSTYWEDAMDTVEHTYSSLSGYMQAIGWSASGNSETEIHTNVDPMFMENMPSVPRETRRNSLLMSPGVRDLFHNPYVTVRGHQPHIPMTSMEAIRSLISTVPADPLGEGAEHISDASSLINNDSVHTESWRHGIPATNLIERNQAQPHGFTSSASETASQLAEGTLRAFRDIALDEAVELHEALRYWSYRWERPFLSWLEAGPVVWVSEEGYRHQKVGQTVSQIQAVLARRCAAIGDLQSHLLRAGWQRGVAQWGVLGGEWATVAGSDGRMSETTNDIISPRMPTTLPYSFQRTSSEILEHIPPPARTQLPKKGPVSNVSELPQQVKHHSLYYTNVLVKNNDGGHIMIDDPALAEWSVDAMSLVRRQLLRAANGLVVLPYAENWAEGDDQSRHSYDPAGSMLLETAGSAVTDETVAPGKLPLWASMRLRNDQDEHPDAFDPVHVKDDENTEQTARLQISDLPLLVSEVSELLDVMDSVIQMQRARRLEKLKPMSWLRRNWYMGALSIPPLMYFAFKEAKNGYGLHFLNSIRRYIALFFREHVVDPLFAMYEEFTKGTVDISDRQARDVAIENLQKMIRSWLDETHPDMPLKQRKRMARAMDISLIEAEKEESMKTIYNINSVIRMSFIEAQFLKKEMMNALLAMDEMRASTNFNMNMAAVTPFVLAVWAVQKTFKFVYYAILKMGKSREETYGSFFHLLTEIERLLVMRDNPPAPSPNRYDPRRITSPAVLADCVLNEDDLGMLMLHIHELRTVLWQDRTRFSPNIIRSVAEDLAELAGERGAVSVRQQLQIVARMCRTYPFLRSIDDRMFDYRHH
jgi:ATP synthase regulation protein NCA2